MKVNSVIIIKKLSSLKNEHNEEKFYNEKMLMKICAARYENDFFCSQNFVKIFIEIICLNFKESKIKESHSARDKKYSQRKLFECSEFDE